MFQTSVLTMSQNINQSGWVAPITVLGHIKGHHQENFNF